MALNPITDISVSKIYVLATEPTNKTKDRFWFDTTNNILKRYDGTTWKPISVSSDDVVVLSDGSKISLTTYLNNQIATLAEGIDTKQDKLKFYSEVDKSTDTSSTAKGSEINLKTSASQYGGSEINLIATNGQYQPGNINLKAKSYDAATGGNIILESEGGSGSGGKITLYSKVNTDGSAEPGGNINIIADSGTGTESNIKLQADNITLTADNAIVLNSGLSGSGISTYIKGTTPDNESPTITVVDTKVPSEKAVYNALETKQKKLSTYSETIPTDKSYPEEVIITAKGQNLQASNGAGKITLSATDSSDSGDGFAAGTINLNASKVQKNGKDIAITDDLTKKQDKLKTYSEIWPSGGIGSAEITAEQGFSIDSKQVKIGGGIFGAETIIDGNIKGDSASSKIRVAGQAILIQEINSENEGSSIELTQSGLIINSDDGITGNILEKTISSSSTDTKIPTAKSVYTAVNAKANKSTTLSGYGITNAYTKTDVDTELGNKQDKLTTYTETPVSDSTGVIGSTVQIDGVAITLNPTNNGSVILHNSITGSAISTSIPTSNAVDTKLPSEKAVRTELNKKQDTLTAGTNISISNNKISVSGLTKSSVGLGNVDNTSDKNKPISTATQTALDAKQNQLVFYTENTSSDEAYIQGADSFSVQNTNKGLIVDGNNGGITVKNNSFNEGQGIISIAGNVWKNGNRTILFDIEGQGVEVSDALLIPEIKNKQNSSDSSLTTNDKTIVGAINELNNQVNTTIPEPITSVYTINSTALSSIISNTTYAGVSGQILISADVSNTGPILIGENISDKANAFPIYPDQIFPIPFSDINNFKVTGTVNDKFNYIISFRSLSNTSSVANGGITILNENGYYKLTPEGDGNTATLVITKLK